MPITADQLIAQSVGDGSSYASYSSEIYLHKYLTGQTPNFTTDFLKLEASAKTKLAPEAYDYAAGGASTSSTARANVAAFDKVT
jgi:lactate 2-monooxygenase